MERRAEEGEREVYLEEVMHRKGVDDSPEHDHARVEEFLTAFPTSEPARAETKHDEEDGGVSDECSAHDEVRLVEEDGSAKSREESGRKGKTNQTLPHMISGIVEAEPETGDTAQQHLHPPDERETLPDDPMHQHDSPPDLRPLEDMQLQKDAARRLENHVPPQVASEVCVSGHVEPSAGVVVAEVVTGEGEDDGEGLEGGVEAGAGEAEDHAWVEGRVSVGR